MFSGFPTGVSKVVALLELWVSVGLYSIRLLCAFQLMCTLLFCVYSISWFYAFI